jgi:hypothetical protein
MSNMVYKMDYRTFEKTRYDSETKKSIPVAWEISWNVRTNSPNLRNNSHIAGQSRKSYTNKEDMEKYLAGRIKAYSHLFTEISPPIPKEYAPHFRMNGLLLPGYTAQGEEPKHPEIKPPEHKTEVPAAEHGGVFNPTQNEPRKERVMETKLNVLLVNCEMYRTGSDEGVWLKLPVNTEQLQSALARIGATDGAQNKDFFIAEYESSVFAVARIPLEKIQAANINELNFLAAKLEALEPVQIEKINAAVETSVESYDIHKLIEFTHNTNFFVHNSGVFNNIQLGEHCLSSGLIEIPEEWLGAINIETLGELASISEKGVFTQYGYIYPSGDEWEAVKEIPSEYRISSKSNIHDIDKNAPLNSRPDKNTREVEAESIAYVVCQHYGLDTSEYSFGYVATWSGDKELNVLKSSLDIIRKEADAIIADIDKNFAELSQEKAVDLNTVAAYMQKLYDGMQAVKPDSPMGEGSYNATIKLLNKSNERIPDTHPSLKAVLLYVTQSPDFNTLKERMETLKTDFIQHYSTAVQNTIDTSGKAETPTAARQPPAQGENVAAIEAKVKAGESINLTDLSDAVKKDKHAAKPPTPKATNITASTRTSPRGGNKTAPKPYNKPSIKEELAANKKQLSGQKSTPARTANKNQNVGLGA